MGIRTSPVLRILGIKGGSAMNRRIAVLLSAVIFLCLSAPVSAQQPVTLRWAEIHEPAYPTTVGAFEVAKLVKERTKGRVIIEIHHSMALGDEAAVMKKIQDGEIDLTRTNIGPVTRYVPGLNAFLMSYIFRDVGHMLKVVNGSIGNDVLNSAGKSDMIGFGWYDGGTRSFYTKQPVKGPGDLKSMRIRTLQNELMTGMVDSFGAKAVPMPHGETYAALQRGDLDGAENNYPTYDETKHYTLCKYFIEDEHTRNPDIIIGSKKSLTAKLSDKEIEIIKQAVRETQPLQFRLWAETVEKSKKKVVGEGSVVTMVSPQLHAAFLAVVKPIYDKQPADIQVLVARIRDTN
jgi:TRAP-type C4-dicarboxylate transport system substrate-binding protein